MKSISAAIRLLFGRFSLSLKDRQSRNYRLRDVVQPDLLSQRENAALGCIIRYLLIWVMAVVAVGLIPEEVMYRRPEAFMQQHIIAIFVADDATLSGRSAGMASIAVTFFPPRVVRSWRILGMA